MFTPYILQIFSRSEQNCAFRTKHKFWHFVNKPSWHRELHVQQGKQTPNLHLSLLLSHSYVQTCPQNFVIYSTFKYLMCLIIFKPTIFMHPWKCLSRKVRDHTPNQGNWLVAWSQSVRLLHQGTWGMNLWHNCEKHECQVFHFMNDLQHQHSQCECYSVTE